MPAFGKRSEIGMKADPMMPKACSMPCICNTFTKASSVVIFIVSSPLLEFVLLRFVLKYSREFIRRAAKRGKVSACRLHVHACLRRLDRKRGKQFSVSAEHRDGHAHNPDQI